MSDLRAIIDTLPRAALIVTDLGQVVHANEPAKGLLAERPSWLEVFAEEGPDAAAAREYLSITPIEVGPRKLWIVVPEQRERRADAPLEKKRRTSGENDPLDALPPSLREVADQVVLGLTDKEIAEKTGRPYATVRTYVSKTFKKLGVHSREELIVLALNGGGRGKGSTGRPK